MREYDIIAYILLSFPEKLADLYLASKIIGFDYGRFINQKFERIAILCFLFFGKLLFSGDMGAMLIYSVIVGVLINMVIMFGTIKDINDNIKFSIKLLTFSAIVREFIIIMLYSVTVGREVGNMSRPEFIGISYVGFIAIAIIALVIGKYGNNGIAYKFKNWLYDKTIV